MQPCKYSEFSLERVCSEKQVKNAMLIRLPTLPVCISHRNLVQIREQCLHNAILVFTIAVGSHFNNFQEIFADFLPNAKPYNLPHASFGGNSKASAKFVFIGRLEKLI